MVYLGNSLKEQRGNQAVKGHFQSIHRLRNVSAPVFDPESLRASNAASNNDYLERKHFAQQPSHRIFKLSSTSVNANTSYEHPQLEPADRSPGPANPVISKGCGC
jgi:hypothetical protein